MKNKLQVIIYISVVILLFLSAYNLNSYFEQKKVLGIKVEKEISDSEYWRNFIKSNPKYLPAYLELGEIEKVKKLDPNFIP